MKLICNKWNKGKIREKQHEEKLFQFLGFGDDENPVAEEPIYTEKGYLCPACWHEVEHLFPYCKQTKNYFDNAST